MLPPNSPVPHSVPVAGLGAAVLAYRPGVSESEFIRHFPLNYSVQAFTIYEAQKNGWDTDRTFWKFLAPFRYVSDTWGSIDIPANFVTDFASVPPRLQSCRATLGRDPASRSFRKTDGERTVIREQTRRGPVRWP